MLVIICNTYKYLKIKIEIEYSLLQNSYMTKLSNNKVI